MFYFKKSQLSKWGVYFLLLPLFFVGYVFGSECPKGQDCSGKTKVTIGKVTYQGCLENGVRAFKGIKYATAERWKAPVRFNPPAGLVHAECYGKMCAQVTKEKPFNPGTMCEDCLFLNVWTPDVIKEQTGLPVMVFIHGGAFVEGAGSSPLFDGTNLITKNDNSIVVVTLNYRLGILGFLYQKDDESGNFGIQDQIMALQWVQDNIKHFGGDPRRVTIVGESAGAASVGIHLAREPEENITFKQAIMESPIYGMFNKSAAEAKDFYDKVVDRAKEEKYCDGPPEDCDTKQILDIQLVIADLLSNIKSPGVGLEDLLVFSPYIDKIIIKGQPIDARISKPVIIGNNKDEATLFISWAKLFITKKIYTDLINLFFPDIAEKILEKPRYNPESPNTAYDALNNLVNDALFVCATDYVLGRANSTNKYGYDYTYIASFNFWAKCTACADKACHGDELPFVFYNFDKIGVQPSDKDKDMAEKMGTYWNNFIKNSSPNPPSWKPYKNYERYILDVNSSGNTNDNECCYCQFWADNYYSKPKPGIFGQKFLIRMKKAIKDRAPKQKK